jgi:hypothetical protein
MVARILMAERQDLVLKMLAVTGGTGGLKVGKIWNCVP